MTPTPQNFRHYLAVIARLAGGIVALVALVNYWVDPHARLGRNPFGYYTTAESQFKLLGLQRHPNDAVLLGDSKAALTDAAMLNGRYTFFNAGLGGATIEQMQALLGHVPPSAPLVIVAFDFLQFRAEKPVDPDPLPRQTLHDILVYLFSRQTFAYSLKTLFSAALGLPPTYREDGTFVATGWYQHYDQENPVAHARMLDQREAELHRFRFSPDRLALLENLRAQLQARGKPYLTFILPLQGEELGRLRRAGLGPAFDAWRARVREVFPNVVDLTDSSYADPKNFFRQDLLHPYPNVSADMINRDVLPRLKTPAPSSP